MREVRRERLARSNHSRQEGLSIREIAARFGLGRSALTDMSKCGTAEIAATPDELAQAVESNP